MWLALATVVALVSPLGFRSLRSQDPSEGPASQPTESAPESQPAAVRRAIDEVIAKPGSDTRGGKIAERPYDVSGHVSLSYRGRFRGDRNDEDLYGYLSLDGGHPE